MDWKNRLEKTIGMNTAVVKAEQSNFLNRKVIEDLERKNKVLHRCAFTAHAKIAELAQADNGTDYKLALEELLKTMEEILNAGTSEERTLDPEANTQGNIIAG